MENRKKANIGRKQIRLVWALQAYGEFKSWQHCRVVLN
jgi:hypothetical protein